MKHTKLLIASAMIAGLAPCHAREKMFGDGLLPSFLADFDTNGDGRIDEEERQAIVEARENAKEERRDEIDTDDDGEISSEEREAAREEVRTNIEEKRKAKFAEIAGEDGVLSLAEFSAIPGMADVPPLIKTAIFTRLDKNADNSVDFEEFSARLRNHRPRTAEDGGAEDLVDTVAPVAPAP